MIYASCQGHYAGEGGPLYPAGYWITASAPAASTASTGETSALPLFRDLCVYTVSPSVLSFPLHSQIRLIPLCSSVLPAISQWLSGPSWIRWLCTPHFLISL